MHAKVITQRGTELNFHMNSKTTSINGCQITIEPSWPFIISYLKHGDGFLFHR